MTIHRFLQNVPSGPEEIGRLVAANEATLKVLGLSNRSDPMTELVAKKILEFSQNRDLRPGAAFAAHAQSLGQ